MYLYWRHSGFFIVTTAAPTWDWNCLDWEFQCHNGQCVTYHCVCDSDCDCYDCTDEDYIL